MPSTNAELDLSLVEMYLSSAPLKTSDIVLDSLEITFANGESDTLPADMSNVLSFKGSINESGRLTQDQVLALGLVVGAALQRDGLVPQQFVKLVSMIEGSNPNA